MRLAPLLLVLSTTAAAASPDGEPDVQRLHQTARSVARDGRCETLPVLGERIRALDPAYHDEVYAVDPVITGCLQLDAHVLERGLPPSATAVIATVPPLPSQPMLSPMTGTLLSLGGTAAGFALFALAAKLDNSALGSLAGVGIFVGPSLGHIYAGHTWNAGLGVRIASTAVATVGIGMALSCFWYCSASEQRTADTGGEIAIAGLVGYAAGTIMEIATAGGAVDDANRERGYGLAIAPLVLPHGGGAGVSVRF